MLQRPEPRGEVSERLLAEIGRDPHPIGELDIPAPADPLADEDLQLALYACYELHYRGLPGASDEWEWEPTLLAARRQLEQHFLGGDRRDPGRRVRGAATPSASTPCCSHRRWTSSGSTPPTAPT